MSLCCLLLVIRDASFVSSPVNSFHFIRFYGFPFLVAANGFSFALITFSPDGAACFTKFTVMHWCLVC